MPLTIRGGTGAWIVKVEDLPLLLTVDEAAHLLRIGRNGAYAAVANGSIPAVRIGRTIRIPRDALAGFLGAASPSAAKEASGTGA